MIKKPVELGFLPGYTGRMHFSHGLQYPNVSGGMFVTQCYDLEETKSDVKDWYLASLPHCGWTVGNGNVTETRITARHKDRTAGAIFALAV